MVHILILVLSVLLCLSVENLYSIVVSTPLLASCTISAVLRYGDAQLKFCNMQGVIG